VQILTCRIGDIVWIENDICVTVQSRYRQRITVSVIASAHMKLHFGGTVLRPSVLPSGTCSYLFSLQGLRQFQIGEIEIRAWLPGDTVPTAADCLNHLHIGVIAPEPCRIRHDRVTCMDAVKWFANDASPPTWGFAC
jgi:hypothetical protein